MKTVSSLAQATSLAARSGATLEVNGRRINSAGTKLSVVAAKPAAEPVAPPPGPEKADPLERLALLVARQGESMRSAVEALAARPSVAPAPPPVVTRAVKRRPTAFDIERNDEGVPIRIIPVYE